MSPFTVWRCPDCGEPVERRRYPVPQGDYVCRHASGFIAAVSVEAFSVEEIRERLLSEEVDDAMEIEALDPLGIGCTPRQKRRRVLEAALDLRFPTQQEQPPTTTEGDS